MSDSRGSIAVVGMGYVGIPAAVLLADAGYQVTGIQRRSQRSGWKIAWLNEGRCPIGGEEPQLEGILRRVVDEEKLKVTDEYSAITEADIILIDVQTAADANHIPRYDSLTDACHDVGRQLSPGKTVIVESTVGPGTTERLVRPILEQESTLKAGLPDGFGLCFSYERVMVGRLVHNIREYPKIVGGIDDASTTVAMNMYRAIVRGGVYGADIITAEIAKTVENAYRDVQIAFANEVALLCETLGADVYDVRRLVNGLPNDASDPKTNPLRNMHFPGAGVGGHCLPKDTWLLMHAYNQYGCGAQRYPASVLTNARRLNDWMPMHMVELLESGLTQTNREVKGSKVCVLGYAFLENSDDSRNTPTASLLRELRRRGATFTVQDPLVNQDSEYPIERDLEAALAGCDALVLMTGHNQYRTIEPATLKALMRGTVIVDGRNIFDANKFTAAGFVFRGVGKGNVNNRTPAKEGTR